MEHLKSRISEIREKLTEPPTELRLVGDMEVEVFTTWGDNDIRTVVSKYLHPRDEGSLRNLYRRVSRWVANELTDSEGADGFREAFEDALYLMQVCQVFHFNSPVYFNVGIDELPQTSACFIVSVEDSLESISNWLKVETKIFSSGSGSGVDVSPIRAKGTPLSGGHGVASGPGPFMETLDVNGGAIKSGGKTRRSAMMRVMRTDHPDIGEFIRSKAREERHFKELRDFGYDVAWNSEDSVQARFGRAQNANISCRASKEFMIGALEGPHTDQGKVLWDIAEATWECGDPGLQFDDTINDAHLVPSVDRIRASNPCSEYVFLNDSACNLASINLLKVVFGVHEHLLSLETVVPVISAAMDTLIDGSSFPTEEIAQNSIDYRPLGLGYANLGAWLMFRGLRYGSREACEFAGTFAKQLQYWSVWNSAHLAKLRGVMKGFEDNSETIMRVLGRQTEWGEELKRLVWANGIRNAQFTVLAPTGTIGLAMGCETLGIEPYMSLQAMTKTLAGGGEMHFEDYPAVEAAKSKFGENAPCLVSVNDLTPADHINMMAAAQKHLSGAISKTVNMPSTVTVQEIYDCYVDAWQKGVKAIAIFRYGCKVSQPHNTEAAGGETRKPIVRGVRHRLAQTREGKQHKFAIGQFEGVIGTGNYHDGSLGEVFLTLSKGGSTLNGFASAIGVILSVALQYGVPPEVIVSKLKGTSFSPQGLTDNQQIRMSTSVLDYVGRFLEQEYLGAPETKEAHKANENIAEGNPCPSCGSFTVRLGGCDKCMTCGYTGGCS